MDAKPSIEDFRNVWLVDYEFIPGDPFCDPLCLVAHEYHNGQTIRLWRDQFGDVPPYSIGPDSLFVAYAATAELGCHLALGWAMPTHVLDLYFEFRRHTNGVLHGKARRGLLDAMVFYKCSGIDAIEKREMIDRILLGHPFTAKERVEIVAYCESDVLALRQLLPAMLSVKQPAYFEISLPHAILRGRYAAALARTESHATPIDVSLFRRFQTHRESIQDLFIRELDEFHLYDGRTFKLDRFGQLLSRDNIPWPATEKSGRLVTDDDTFKDLSNTYPQLESIRRLRQALSLMQLHELAVSPTGRNRCFLRPFRSRTGRNQPSNAGFIWGMAKWYRGLIKPPEGYGLAYLDFGGQEFGVAAAYSQDPNMIAAYLSGEAYLWFAKKGGLVPGDANKETHGKERSLYKTAVLAINYVIGETALGILINKPTLFARHLIGLHHDLFPQYWRWSDRMVNHAQLFGYQSTVFDWVYRVPVEPNPNMLRNFPIQSGGAEMVRLGHCLATERGLQVCAPVHDAYLIMARLDELDDAITEMRNCMVEASRAVLNGFELFIGKPEVVRYPERYSHADGKEMWTLVMDLLAEAEAAESRSPIREFQPV